MRLNRLYKQFPLYDIKIMLGDTNAKLGQEIWSGIAVHTCDLHNKCNENVLKLVTYNHSGNFVCYVYVCIYIH